MYRNILCLVMAGGRGSRYGSPEKIVLNVCGKKLIGYVIDVIRPLCRDIVLAISRNTYKIPEVRNLCIEGDIDCVETSGMGYVEDLSLLLCSIRKPILVMPADIIIRRGVVEDFVERAMKMNEDVITMAIEGNGVEEPIGIGLFNSCGGNWANIVYSPKSAVDIDTRNDLEIAESMCRDME